ncbi:hypothetical protein [Amycolatopsis nigrescens]|uniref:hypothetical protein n=1 Tax=Amycolatopsis nigrescens TaxID=381445 RepID=UPI00037DC877|nr:hypothetical protein [Amycolatopsis nigrescens]
MSEQRTRWIAALLLGLTGLTGLLAVFDLSGPLRLAVTVAFFALVPGWAVLANFGPGTGSTTWALAVALSVAVDLIIAQVMLLTGAWSPATASVCLLSVSAVLLVVRLVPVRFSRADAGGGR